MLAAPCTRAKWTRKVNDSPLPGDGLLDFERKRDRSCGDEASESDRIQVIAYALLLEEHCGKPVKEGRVRYYANNKTVRLPIDAEALEKLRAAIAHAEGSISI